MKTVFDEMTRNIANDLIDSYAVDNGYTNGDNMVASLYDDLKSAQPIATQENAADKTIQFVKDIVPQIFKQMVDNKAQYGNYINLMMDDGWLKIDEGNGQTFFSNMTGAPDNTTPLASITSKLNNKIDDAPNYQGSITYYKDTAKKVMSDYAYAFHKAIDTQETMILDMFRTGAGKAFLRAIVEQLYSSYVYTLFNFGATAKFGIDLTKEVNGRNLVQKGVGENAFTCGIEIMQTIQDMCLNSNKYNYDGNFIRMSSCALEDIVIYLHTDTYTTLKHCLLSQLYNSGEFTDILNKVDFKVPGYKLKGAKITTDASTGVHTVDTENLVTPSMNMSNINATDKYIGITTDEQIIPKNQVGIMTKGGQSFRGIQQVDLTAKQFFAYNFTTTNSAFTYGAMRYVPDGKIVVYQNDNLNTNPTNATITLATETGANE